ncbi:OadG-related small transporter subunit [Caproicibacter sp.]|uniref:OadG-related small transporter subunit n=1 Tax=Caproicibacter sp. TaxID=2814884 RepID=UPI003988FCFF
MNYGFLLSAYQGPVGPVNGADVGRSLELMGKGMAGIFVVMLLIFLVIVALNRWTKNKD